MSISLIKKDIPKTELPLAPSQGAMRPKMDGRKTEQHIERELIKAVMERRLKPGAKLDEDVLADVFGISRTRVRKVLSSLVTQLIGTHKPNYGTFVAKPSVAEARDVFEARRGIEELLMRILAAKKPDFSALRRHVLDEQRAYDSKHAGAIEISGDFHLMLADLAGNSVLNTYMHQLVTRTILIQVLYGPQHICLAHDHADVLDALEHGNEGDAVERMSRHFDAIQGSCNLREMGEESADLRAIFSQTRQP